MSEQDKLLVSVARGAVEAALRYPALEEQKKCLRVALAAFDCLGQESAPLTNQGGNQNG